MKRIILILITLLSLLPLAAKPITFGNERLSFRVTYKWGIIQKTAGDATLDLTHTPDGYKSILTARTRPWADHIFSVRDTLRGRMTRETMLPLLYDKMTYEGGDFRHDIIHYTYQGDRVTAKARRYKSGKKGKIEQSDTILYTSLPVVDMLSVFYHVRRLPYETMTPGDVAHSNIVSGTMIEHLAIQYKGVTTVSLDECDYTCYEIHFRFSSERIKDSSKPMKAWIRTDGQRIPIKLQGELPIGKIQILWNNPEKQ